jgi:hypothetical protein
MTHTTKTLPETCTAGLDFHAAVHARDYPAPQWTLSAFLRGPRSIDLTATGDGDTFTFDVPAAETSQWVAGEYWYTLRATNGSAVVEVVGGRLTVKPDLAAMTEPYDGRSLAELALESIEAVLAKRATQDQQRYTINGRELWRTPIPELLKLRTFYAVQVSRERARNSGKNSFGRPIYVKFQ